MKMILNRDNLTTLLETKGTFIPKIYTKSSIFKNEMYELQKIENGIAHYEFLYERSHCDGLIVIGRNSNEN